MCWLSWFSGPGLLVSRASSRSLRLCPWTSICFHGPLKAILGSAAPSSPATRAITGRLRTAESRLTILAASYRSAEAPARQKCRKSASESAGPKRGAEESAEKVLQASSLCSSSNDARSLEHFFGTFLGTPFGAGTFRSTFSALLPGRGFGTSVAGRQDCKSRREKQCSFCVRSAVKHWGRAKRPAKASCGETVVQKGVFGESVSSLPPYGFQDLSGVLREILKGAEKKRTFPTHLFGQPFLRMTPSPLLWRALKHLGKMRMGHLFDGSRSYRETQKCRMQAVRRVVARSYREIKMVLYAVKLLSGPSLAISDVIIRAK